MPTKIKGPLDREDDFNGGPVSTRSPSPGGKWCDAYQHVLVETWQGVCPVCELETKLAAAEARAERMRVAIEGFLSASDQPCTRIACVVDECREEINALELAARAGGEG